MSTEAVVSMVRICRLSEEATRAALEFVAVSVALIDTGIEVLVAIDSEEFVAPDVYDTEVSVTKGAVRPGAIPG